MSGKSNSNTMTTSPASSSDVGPPVRVITKVTRKRKGTPHVDVISEPITMHSRHSGHSGRRTRARRGDENDISLSLRKMGFSEEPTSDSYEQRHARLQKQLEGSESFNKFYYVKATQTLSGNVHVDMMVAQSYRVIKFDISIHHLMHLYYKSTKAVQDLITGRDIFNHLIANTPNITTFWQQLFQIKNEDSPEEIENMIHSIIEELKETQQNAEKKKADAKKKEELRAEKRNDAEKKKTDATTYDTTQDLSYFRDKYQKMMRLIDQASMEENNVEKRNYLVDIIMFNEFFTSYILEKKPLNIIFKRFGKYGSIFGKRVGKIDEFLKSKRKLMEIKHKKQEAQKSKDEMFDMLSMFNIGENKSDVEMDQDPSTQRDVDEFEADIDKIASVYNLGFVKNIPFTKTEVNPMSIASIFHPYTVKFLKENISEE